MYENDTAKKQKMWTTERFYAETDISQIYWFWTEYLLDLTSFWMLAETQFLNVANRGLTFKIRF